MGRAPYKELKRQRRKKNKEHPNFQQFRLSKKERAEVHTRDQNGRPKNRAQQQANKEIFLKFWQDKKSKIQIAIEDRENQLPTEEQLSMRERKAEWDRECYRKCWVGSRGIEGNKLKNRGTCHLRGDFKDLPSEFLDFELHPRDRQQNQQKEVRFVEKPEY